MTERNPKIRSGAHREEMMLRAWLTFFHGDEQQAFYPVNFNAIGAIRQYAADAEKKRAEFELASDSAAIEEFIQVGLTDEVVVTDSLGSIRRSHLPKYRFNAGHRVFFRMKDDVLGTDGELFSGKVSGITYDRDTGVAKIELYSVEGIKQLRRIG